MPLLSAQNIPAASSSFQDDVQTKNAVMAVCLIPTTLNLVLELVLASVSTTIIQHWNKQEIKLRNKETALE